MIARATLAMALMLVGGCAPSLTELVVVVGSDLQVPSELDAIEIRVTSPDGPEVPVNVEAPPLPVSLGVVHRGGPLGPIRVEARGTLDGVLVVARIAETELVAGEVRELRLDLTRSCVSLSCPEAQSCRDGACRPIAIPGSELPRWTGGLDAGPQDVPMDGPSIDGARDDDASLERDAPLEADVPLIDAGIPDAPGPRDAPAPDAGHDASTPDVGAPDAPLPTDAGCSCALDHATARCAPSGCLIESCETGWSDCDGMAATGCERSIRTVDDCGACGRVCLSLAGTTGCGDGTCRVVDCYDSRRADCNGSVSDGCEIRTENDADNCGACGVVCPEGQRCHMSSCRRRGLTPRGGPRRRCGRAP